MNSHPLTTIDSIKATIENDRQTFRWFLLLVLESKIKHRLKRDLHAARQYHLLKGLLLKRDILYMFMCVWLAASFIMPRPVLVLTTGIILFGYFHYRLQTSLGKITAEVSACLLNLDFKEKELRAKTLYQISEQYARQYHMPSLVDAVAAFDRILRMTFCGVLLLGLFLQALNWKLILLMMGSVYFGVYCFLNTTFIYKRLK